MSGYTTACLHVLLWSSVIVISIQVYVLASGSIDETWLPSLILTGGSGILSISYTILHTVFSKYLERWSEAWQWFPQQKTVSYVSVRWIITCCALWLCTSGWNVLVAARKPTCGEGRSGHWDKGCSCIIERVSVALGLLALIASCTLFGLLQRSPKAFRAHLIGSIKQPVSLLPLKDESFASSATEFEKNASTTLSSVSSFNLATSSPNPEQPFGLGIYADPSRRMSSEISLTSTISSPRIKTPPPAQIDSAWRAVHPPSFSFRHVSLDTIRPLPDPISPVHLSPLSPLTPIKHVGQKSLYQYSSSSSSSISSPPRSPLSTMRRANEPDVTVLPEPRFPKRRIVPPHLPEIQPLKRMTLPAGWRLQMRRSWDGSEPDEAMQVSPLVIRKRRTALNSARNSRLSGKQLRRSKSLESIIDLALRSGVVERTSWLSGRHNPFDDDD